ncbi:MAG TPA: hypothetical protein VF444_07955 [Pseudonocardiaceae bacterium]
MSTLLDDLLPSYDLREYHETRIAAPPARVWRAVDDMRIRDLPLTVGLARLRGGPGAWFDPDWAKRQDASLDARALDNVAPRTLVADEPREMLLGDIARYTMTTPVRPDTIERGDRDAFAAFDEAGWTKVAMNFLFTETGDGTTLLSTETRVLATDPATRRSFRLYWLAVRVGSGLVRRDILNAARAAATKTKAGQ